MLRVLLNANQSVFDRWSFVINMLEPVEWRCWVTMLLCLLQYITEKDGVIVDRRVEKRQTKVTTVENNEEDDMDYDQVWWLAPGVIIMPGAMMTRQVVAR